MQIEDIRKKSLSYWLKKLGWQGGTIHQVENELQDEWYILRKLRMIEGLKPYDKVYISKNEAVLISLQNNHPLPKKGYSTIHARQKGIGDTLLGKDKNDYFISLC